MDIQAIHRIELALISSADESQNESAIASAVANASHELREYFIDGGGLHIGEMLPGQEGLLGGRPTRAPRPARVASSADKA